MRAAAGSGPEPRTARLGAGRAIRWLLMLQVGIAVLLMAGDLARVAPWGLVPGRSTTPAVDTPVRPGDQTRRYAPRFPLRDAPGGPAFPAEALPDRLRWEAIEVDGAAALLLTGRIEAGDGARFADHLDGLPELPATVALHSPGGSVRDALEIGRRLRAEGMAARVAAGAACFSACPYILAGGVEREVSLRAMVGVHQHYFGESTVLPAFLAVEDIQRGQAEVMSYLDEMGVSPLLVAKAMQTPPEDIYILVREELEELGVATEVLQ
jgi:hypothetical protein